MKYKPPFPYFGGKSRIAHEVWARFGDVRNYIEPFFGSGAVLLNRPESHKRKFETITDADHNLVNFWRAVKYKPDEVAYHCDWPVSMADMHARTDYIHRNSAMIQKHVLDDPKWCDPELAAWYAWCLSLGIACGFYENNKAIPHLHNNRGIQYIKDKPEYFANLMDRLKDVRICYGDWRRICGAGSLYAKKPPVGIFFDPPYSAARYNVYAQDSNTVALDVLEWCKARGNNPDLRIALCGYFGEHNELEERGWSVYRWKASGGFSRKGKRGESNARLETIWFSPACLKVEDAQCQLI
jgi:DNA adenine methylase